MKKCITILAAALSLMLCGCNKNTEGEQSGSQEALSAIAERANASITNYNATSVK